MALENYRTLIVHPPRGGGYAEEVRRFTAATGKVVIEVTNQSIAADASAFVIIRNVSTDKTFFIADIESFSAQVESTAPEGTSLVNFDLIYEPDLTGSSEGPSIDEAAYRILPTGSVENIEDTELEIRELTSFNPALPGNQTRFSTLAGSVSFYDTNQSTSNSGISFSQTIDIPYPLVPGGQIVLALVNQLQLDNGVNTLMNLTAAGYSK